MDFKKTIDKIDKQIDYIFHYYTITKINTDEQSKLIEKTFNLEKEIMELKIKLYLKKLDTKYKKNIDLLDDKINILKDYNLNILHLNKVKKLNLMTLINLVFLPLGIIVGYFGMNFKSMTYSNGIFSVKYGNTLVILLFIIFIILFTLIYFYIEKNNLHSNNTMYYNDGGIFKTMKM